VSPSGTGGSPYLSPSASMNTARRAGAKPR
jgi:hypothetical protein